MTFDLLAGMEKDGFDTSRKSTSRSGQYNGPCIFACNGLGKDRLRVQPSYGEYGWFACNQCNAKGSGIDYLMIKRGYSKQQALAEVGWRPKDGSEPHFIIPKSVLTGERQPTHEVPSTEWQEAALTFVQYSENILWSERGRLALDYLRARGLKDATIKMARFGYNPAEMKRLGRKWGSKKLVTLYQGIVIPWFIGDDIWRITVRDETVAEGNDRYRQVAGGSNGLYLGFSLGYGRPVILVEGEIDALSIAQECGHDVSVVATGSTEGSHIARWIGVLAVKELVLIAFDAEERGDKAAQRWIDCLGNAHRLRPWWKDANQMLQDGVDLRNDWVMPRLDLIVDEMVRASMPPIIPLDDVREKKTYTPVSLPPLPRTACPCIHIAWDSNGVQKKQPCRNNPLSNGWCSEHQHCHMLLGVGAELGYPEVQIPFTWKHETLYRTIPEGIHGWERHVSQSHADRPHMVERDIEIVRIKYEHLLLDTGKAAS